MAQAPTEPMPAIATRMIRADCLVANLTELWHAQPDLARALESIPDNRVPVPQDTPDGACTITAPTEDGRRIYLHSRRQPLAEAQTWADSLDLKDRQVVLVHGFALGHHVAALWERLPGTALLLIAEPDKTLLRAALACRDYTDMLSSGRVWFYCELDRAALAETMEPRGAFLTSGTLLAAHGPSLRLNPAFHRDFEEQFKEFVGYLRVGLVTLMLNNVTTCRNIANNIGRYVTARPLPTVRGAYTNRPAILVAAGPSLQRNVHLLPQAREGAVLIAVQTVLQPLLAAGIVPDFVTSLDYHAVSGRFFEQLAGWPGATDVHMVAESKVHHGVLDMYAGGMSLASNAFADQLLGRGTDPLAQIQAGSTVAHLSFYLAEYLGCDPIVLVGQDLGFVDGLYYKPGTAIHDVWSRELDRFHTLETKEWERIVRSRSMLRKIEDIHGNAMYTEDLFFTYLQQFERDFAVSRSRVIDATEGGARKRGVTNSTLAEVIAAYCRTPLKRVSPGGAGAGGPERLVGPLNEALDALGRRKENAEDLINHCETVAPLLEEMLLEQENTARMDELFVRVDRLRAKASMDRATLEMASALNTIGTLRRFYHDLAVKAAADDSLEKQRRQIERDIDNVKHLAVGCRRLLGILDEASARLKRQIAAAESGAAWPRD